MSYIQQVDPRSEVDPLRSDDPWAHRSANMRCLSCMWYMAKQEFQAASKSALGRCRRHAPTLGGFPVVWESDWCGDHKLKGAV
jgi:hypothetical protein